MAMRLNIFSSWNPFCTNSTYLMAALMSVDHKFRKLGWVELHNIWEDSPISVSNDISMYNIAWSELGPWPKGRMLACRVAVMIPGVPQI